MTVNIENETKIKLDIDYKAVSEAVVLKTLRLEHIDTACEVSILLVNNKAIREINYEQREIDKATDVLSFPMIDFETPAVLPKGLFGVRDPETGELFLGDIVISLEKVRSQALKYGHSNKREFAFLAAHSMLHLLGYDHVNSEEEAKIMEKKQSHILETLGIGRTKNDIRVLRKSFSSKKRVVVKIGSSSLTHNETGELNLVKAERLVRELTDLKNSGKEVVLVTSGAIMVGRNALTPKKSGEDINFKQACASVGQAKLMMIYQKLFAEYNQLCSQVLLTEENIIDEESRNNAKNTMEELLTLGVIPVVNENDTVATHEIRNLSVLGDNDTLSAIVASVIEADLLILLSDIDGLYTDDPNKNKKASFVELVENIDDKLLSMAKGPASSVGTGGMATKLRAGIIATNSGVDMVIASGDDFSNIHAIIEGEKIGTVFASKKRDDEFLIKYLKER